MWNEGRQPMYDFSLELVMIMPALLLQKPTRNSTAKQHGEYLKKRLNLWTAGHFDELKREGAAIQEQLKKQQRRDETQDHTAKVFAKLMMQGKVHAALRLLDKAASLGVAELTDKTMKALANLHPAAKPANEQILKTGELPYFDPVIFTNINEQSIAKAANKTRGAAGTIRSRRGRLETNTHLEKLWLNRQGIAHSPGKNDANSMHPIST